MTVTRNGQDQVDGGWRSSTWCKRYVVLKDAQPESWTCRQVSGLAVLVKPHMCSRWIEHSTGESGSGALENQMGRLRSG